MKLSKLCLLVAFVLLVMTGCRTRNSSINDPGAASGSDSSAAEDSGSEMENDDAQPSDTDYMSDMEPSDLDTEEGAEEEEGESREEDESAEAVMSADFTEIGALSAEKKGWGSGGPTDDTGRPNGATQYQEQYGELGAYFVAPSSDKVYLTFDEGYENGFTPTILDTLKERDVSAVFFITLDFAQRQPELVQRMIEEGHIVGNHSCKHLSFPDMNLEDAAEDIMKLHDYVQTNFGYEMHLFRPPMGEFSEQTLALLQSLGYKSVFWSFAYQDYDVDNQPLTIEAANKIISSCHPGAIYLLHAVSQTNAEVLGEVIDQIQENGYVFARWDW